MKLRLAIPLSLALNTVAVAASVTEAEACGGCFIPPTQSTVVNAHRMALSVSPAQSVLWDQIQYSGDPTEFAWILPVKQGAFIQLSSDAWFETLDAATTVNVVAPFINCGGSSGGIGCGSADSAVGGGNFAEDGGEDVTVLHRGTVGPYLTVTVTTDTPGALNTWLDTNGFAVDPSTQPIIDAYVAEGFDFIALKLQPNKDIKEMKPVRVVTPGANPALPLRMVAAGTGANVAITLFTISEGRLEPKDFANVAVPVDLISWDHINNESNYSVLREKTLAAANGGRAFLTPFANQGALLSPVFSPNQPFGVTYNVSGSLETVDTIAAAFVLQGVANGETSDGSCASAFSNLALSGAVVANPCPPGVPLDDPTCNINVPSGQTDARLFACGPLDDLATALIGLHPKDVWLTRLETNLPREALDRDLELVPAIQEPVDNWVRARVSVRAEEFCAGTPPILGRDNSARNTGTLVGMALMCFAFAAMFARRGFRTWAPSRFLGAHSSE